MGYGLALLRLFGLSSQPLAVGATTGVAFWLFAGGWLNLMHAASSRIILSLLSLGFVLGLWELLRQDIRLRFRSAWHDFISHRPGRLVGLPILACFLLFFLAQLRPVGWNRFDDTQAYMAFADKAAAMRSLQSDPFSERRTNTGMGGGIFLNVTMLAGTDDSAMGYIDGGFGYAVYVLSIWSLINLLGLRRGRALLLLCLVPIFTQGKLNLTIVYFSAAFFIAMLILLLPRADDEVVSWRKVLLLGLLFGAACTVKSSNIPFGGLFLGFCASGLAARPGGLRKAASFLLAALPVFAVVFPWMVELHRDQATYLFPAFGRGYHDSAFGMLPLPSHTAPTWQSLLVAAPNTLLLLSAGILIYLLSRGRPAAFRIPVLAYFAASVLSTLFIGVSTAGESIDRYTLMFHSPCALMLIAFVLLISNWRGLAGRTAFYALTAAGLACVWSIFYLYLLGNREFLYDYGGPLLSLAGRSDGFQSYDAVLDARAIQENADAARLGQGAVPPGETILEVAATAYGYDWNRNKVYIADYPGMAGLPPGFPVYGDSEGVRRYLLHSGIHYLIYDRSLYVPIEFQSFRDDPMQHTTLREVFSHPKVLRSMHPWSRMEWLVSNHTRSMFEEIAADHKHVYEKGNVEVIQLDDR